MFDGRAGGHVLALTLDADGAAPVAAGEVRVMSCNVTAGAGCPCAPTVGATNDMVRAGNAYWKWGSEGNCLKATDVDTSSGAGKESVYGRENPPVFSKLPKLITRISISIGRWNLPEWFPDQMLRKPVW